MKHLSIIAFSLSSLAGIFVSSANACSVVSDYRVPSNLELVGEADMILLGRVVGEAENADFWKSALLVEPIEAIKGTLPTRTVSIASARLDPPRKGGGSGILSNPYELGEAHPDSYSGACLRRVFPRGTTALFFLRRNENSAGWRSAGDAFSRWAEDVLSEDAPWLQLTRLYTTAATLPVGERAAMLEAKRDRLTALGDDPVAQLMAADIARQFDGSKTTFLESTEGETQTQRGISTQYTAPKRSKKPLQQPRPRQQSKSV